jgi:hypothetical protein
MVAAECRSWSVLRSRGLVTLGVTIWKGVEIKVSPVNPGQAFAQTYGSIDLIDPLAGDVEV